MKKFTKAFTLVEILVVVALLGLIVQAIFSVFNVGRDTFFSSGSSLQLQQSLRLAMDGMSREIRQSSASRVTLSNADTQIDFTIPIDITPLTYSGNITYFLNSNNQIMREHPSGTRKVIANDISALTFTQAGNQIEIEITAAKTVKLRTLTLALKEKIELRNN